MPVLVATSRMYRGEHHPTDALGSLLFAALWLTVVTVVIKPNAAARAGARQARPGSRRRDLASAAEVRGSTARQAVRRG